jgi:hypothetical protein
VTRSAPAHQNLHATVPGSGQDQGRGVTWALAHTGYRCIGQIPGGWLLDRFGARFEERVFTPLERAKAARRPSKAGMPIKPPGNCGIGGWSKIPTGTPRDN